MNRYQIIRTLLIIIFVCCILYLALYFKDAYQEKQKMADLLNSVEIDENVIAENEVEENGIEKNEEKTEKQAEESKEKVTKRMLQVQELQKENKEIIGWLEIEDTNIDYPVMQGKDNDFYMNHNYQKEESRRGSLILDKDYDWSIPSSNLLIYGHNNTLDGSMFADLLKYEDEDFYEEHPSFRFTTAKEDAEYEVIAAFLSRLYYQNETNVFRYYQFIHAENEEEYDAFVKNAKDSSLYDTKKEAHYGEQLITLSTCAYHTEDGRFAVVARKKRKEG